MLWIILITAFAAIPAISQETRPINSAAVSVRIPAATNGANLTNANSDCESELAQANQRLLKTLGALENAEKAIEALKTEIAARDRRDLINEDLLRKKDEIIKSQAELIKILEKQTGRKVSLLWGLIKVRY